MKGKTGVGNTLVFADFERSGKRMDGMHMTTKKFKKI